MSSLLYFKRSEKIELCDYHIAFRAHFIMNEMHGMASLLIVWYAHRVKMWYVSIVHLLARNRLRWKFHNVNYLSVSQYK